jgi:hypothetical protein
MARYRSPGKKYLAWTIIWIYMSGKRNMFGSTMVHETIKTGIWNFTIERSCFCLLHRWLFFVGKFFRRMSTEYWWNCRFIEKIRFYNTSRKISKVPTQILGFELNSVFMTIKLTDKKIEKMKLKIETIRRKVRYTIRDIAEITGHTKSTTYK